MKIPEHMQPAIDAWVNHGIPHPSDMGSFLRAVLQRDFYAAIMFADDENREAIVSWAMYLHNEVPALAHGDEKKLLEWHMRGGLLGRPKSEEAA